MITFHLLSAVEFMRYKTLEIDFGELEGKTIAVTGENGTGKSAIYEALHWCLFGATVRKSMNVHRRAEKTKPVIVTVTGDKNGNKFAIMRTQKHGASTLAVSVNGKLIDCGGLMDTQKYVCDFLGTNSTYFMATTLLGHNSFRFSRATDTDRKMLLEDLLELNKYNIAQECTKILYSNIENKINEKNANITTLSDYVGEPIKAVITNKEAENALKAAVKVHESELKRLNTLLDERQQQLTSKALFSVTNSTVYTARDQLRMEKTRCEDEMADIQTQVAVVRKKKICPTCLRGFTGRQMDEQITKFTDRYHELKKSLIIIDRNYTLYSDFIDILDSIQINEKAQTGTIGELEAIIKERKMRETAYADVKKCEQKMRTDIAKNSRDVIALTKLNEHVMFWVNGFGRQGIISIKLDEAIDELNMTLADLSYLLTDNTIFVKFGSTTALKSKAVSINKISLMCVVDSEDALYNELSNGQRQKVDILVMLAVSKLISTLTTETNILFCDEILEGLDDGATKLLINFIADYAGNIKFMAEHKPSVYLRADEIWKLTSKNNVTTIAKE